MRRARRQTLGRIDLSRGAKDPYAEKPRRTARSRRRLLERAHELGRRLRDDGAEIVLLDVPVGEAISVICRRARERRSLKPNVDVSLATVRNWAKAGFIRWTFGASNSGGAP